MPKPFRLPRPRAAHALAEGTGPDYVIGFGETGNAPWPASLAPVAAKALPQSLEIVPGLWRGPAGHLPGPYDSRGRCLSRSPRAGLHP